MDGGDILNLGGNAGKANSFTKEDLDVGDILRNMKRSTPEASIDEDVSENDQYKIRKVEEVCVESTTIDAPPTVGYQRNNKRGNKRGNRVGSNYPVESLSNSEQRRYKEWSGVQIPEDYLSSMFTEYLGADDDGEDNTPIDGRERKGPDESFNNTMNHSNSHEVCGIVDKEDHMIALSVFAKAFVTELTVKTLSRRRRGVKGPLRVSEIVTAKSSLKIEMKGGDVLSIV